MTKRSARQIAWSQGGLRVVGREFFTHYNKHVRPLLPRCNAKRKRDGEPCCNLAGPNGKCRIHGGATPRGDQYHVRQWPSPKAPNAEAKLQNKLQRGDRAARIKARKLAAMTPDQLAAHKRWQQTHKPGSAAARAADRARRKSAQETRLRFANSEPRSISAEAKALRDRIRELEAERDVLMDAQAQTGPATEKNPPNAFEKLAADTPLCKTGVFE